MKRLVINNLHLTGKMTPADYKGKYGNAMLPIAVNGEILIKNCIFGQNGYNCIEIGLSTSIEPPSKVVIED